MDGALLELFLMAGFRIRRDDPGAGHVIAVFGGIGDRVAHVGDAAFIDQIDDQLDLVAALEIGHLRRVTGFDQGFVTGHDQV